MQQARLNRLRKVLQEQGLKALMVTSAVNRQYLTGFTGSAGYVLITEDKAYLLTDFRYMTQAPKQADGYEVVEHAPKAMETVRDLLNKQSVTKVGFEKFDMTYGSYLSSAEAL